MTAEEKEEPTSKKQLLVRIIGFGLLIGGIILIINGAIMINKGNSMFGDFDAPWFETVSRGGGLLAGGFFMVFPAIFILFVSHATSLMSRPLKHAGTPLGHDNDYERYEKMIEESAKRRATGVNRTEVRASIGGADSVQTVKIRCQLCGALNDDDAEFCDQCSESL